MNPDRFPDAADGRSAMKEFRRDLGMEGDRSRDVPATAPCGCVSDRMAAVRPPVEFYAGLAKTHHGPTGGRAALPSRALSDMKEALHDV